jgi:hypothetical protein
LKLRRGGLLMWKPESFNHRFKLAGATRISSDEYRQIIEHVEKCPSCYSAHADFLSSLEQLPAEEFDKTKVSVLRHIEQGGLKERFVERARAAGIQFSAGVASGREPNSHFLQPYRWVTAAALLGVITVAVGQRIWRQSPRQPQETGIQTASPGIPTAQYQDIQDLEKKLSELQAITISSKREISALKNENTKMLSEISAMGKDLAGRRAENQALQQSLAHLRDLNTQASIENENDAQLLARAQAELDEARTRGKALEAESASQKAEVGTLSQQLAAKTATISHDRELLAAGRDITDLMGARNLHIIDVRDADGKGKNKKSFGRIFYTEGKSLIFYAYDLDQEKATNADYSFEVWGERLGEPASVRSLGILFTDDKEQKRWAFEVDDPQQLAEIDSVFVTLEPHQGDSQPRGGRILFAYLGGRANHP